MYRVIVAFTDAKDNRHIYWTGDEYPRSGAKPTSARIKQLTTDKNKRGIPLIEEIKE